MRGYLAWGTEISGVRFFCDDRTMSKLVLSLSDVPVRRDSLTASGLVRHDGSHIGLFIVTLLLWQQLVCNITGLRYIRTHAHVR